MCNSTGQPGLFGPLPAAALAFRAATCYNRQERSGPLPGAPQKGSYPRRIAVAYANGEICQHFGRTEQFKVYDVENGQVVRSQVVGTGGQGHGALAGVLQQLGADVLICGGIGGGAQAALASAGIRLYGGASGPADAAVDALLAGRLAYQPDVPCDHHGEHHDGGHHCGSHGCAGNGGC